MEAGRELDALIAEKVMGWRWFRFLNKCYLIPPRNTETGFDPAHVLSHWDGEGKEGTPDLEWTTLSSYPNFRLRHYSTDIAAAWEVVEKVQANGWTFHVDDVGFNNGIEGKWRVLLTEAETGDKHVFADGDTAPHAICLAALKAMSATTKSVSS